MATITTTSIPAVIDALLALYRGLSAVTAFVDPTTNTLAPLPVYDGLPGPEPGNFFLQVGGIDVLTADGTQTWGTLGSPNGVAPTRDERYVVNHYMSAFVGGDDALAVTATSDAQKLARDTAKSIVTAVETGIRLDPQLIANLGGNGLGTGWVAFGPKVALEQTTVDDPESGLGRRAVFAFEVSVYKRLYTTS